MPGRSHPAVVLPLVACLLVGAASPAAAAHDDDTTDACPPAVVPPAGFVDVRDGAVHAPNIDCVVHHEVARGVSWAYYAPSRALRRDQAASFLARLLARAGMTLPASPDDHFDDTNGNVHEPAIDQLAELGIVTGTATRRYSPTARISRAQMAALVVRAFEELTREQLPAGGDPFDDTRGIVLEEPVAAAAAAGFVDGVAPRRFDPHGSTTRAQMASLLAGLLDASAERGLVEVPEGWGVGAAPPTLSAQLVTSEVTNPTDITAPTGDPRLFVVEQAGTIRIVRDGQLLATPFLDIRDLTLSGGERGLFALAFHPDYARNRRFYVHHTGRDGETRVARYTTLRGDPDRADPASRVDVLEVPQPFTNHNGGALSFGPDGMLYLGLGDGGSGGDPRDNGQDPSTLLGSILRLDVERAGPGYAVPADNPFADGQGGAPEVWAYGLRNPWRFAFDDVTDHLYIADVGQNDREEVDVTPARQAGVNYGWVTMEGSACYRPTDCDPTGLALPDYEYTHSEGCSITGGEVYRGRAIPSLRGHYLFGDYCRGWVRSFVRTATEVRHLTHHDLGDLGFIMSFGTDGDGEVYVGGTRGVFRLTGP